MFIYLISVLTKNYSILFNGSCNYFNYRHTTNIKTLTHLLYKNGYSEEEVILFAGENSHKDSRNLEKDFYFLNNSLKLENESFPIEDATVQSFFNALILNHKKLLFCDRNTNLLIYLCGHGNKEFIKVKYREAVFAADFNKLITGLAKKVNSILVIIDTCHASSFIPKIVPENVFYAATSKFDQPSMSSNYNNRLGVYCVDNFVYSFFHKKIDYEIGLNEFFKLFSYEEIKSNIVFKGKSNKKVKDFFVQNNEEKMEL